MKRRFTQNDFQGTVLKALALLTLALAGCSGKPAPVEVPKRSLSETLSQQSAAQKQPLPMPAQSGFVGSQVCAECHADLYQSYQTHPMAHAMGTVNREDVLEDFSNSRFSPAAHLSYRVEREGDKFFHHERQEDATGKEIYDQRVEVDYSVGSGARGRSFLSDRNGRLYQSSISWYAAEPHWGLSPGYSAEFHQRFERRVSHACLSCHAGRSNPHPEEMDRFADPPFSELAIGCERCHGPGESHVAFRRAPAVGESALDPIINPASLTPSKQDAVCNQCHLQGKRRVLRNGHTEFDFRPGMSISDLWVTILKTDGVEQGTAAAVSQVEQMQSSTCYLESKGALTCTSCHDPHRSPSTENRISFYRDRCLKCHGSGKTECAEQLEVRKQRTAEDSCIVCHMPSFPAADVHAAQTDHRVQRRPAEPGQSDNIPRLAKALNIVLYKEPGAELPEQEELRARGIYLAEIGLLSNNSEVAAQAIDPLRKVVETEPDDIEARFSLGKSLMVMEQIDDGIHHLGQVLQRRPNHEDCLELLASYCHQKGDLAKARVFYEKLIEVNPDRSRYYGRYAHVLGQLGEMELGIKMIEKALELDPSLQQAHGWLSEVYQQKGNQTEASRHARILQQFQSLRPTQ